MSNTPEKAANNYIGETPIRVDAYDKATGKGLLSGRAHQWPELCGGAYAGQPAVLAADAGRRGVRALAARDGRHPQTVNRSV